MGSQCKERKAIPAQTLSFPGFQTIGHIPQIISLLLVSNRGSVGTYGGRKDYVN